MRTLRMAGILVAALAFLPPAALADMQRDLGSFFLVAARSISGKNLSVDGPCDMGVVCAQPSSNSSCGTASFEDVTFADGSQLGADVVSFNKPGASVFDLFTNGPTPRNVTVRDGGGALSLPLFPGACGAGCAPDVAALESMCGFPTPFPSCDASRPVTVGGGDCPNGLDTVPGNGRCDLPPGTYGDMVVRDNAKLSLSAGTYVACTFLVGKNAVVTGHGVALQIDGGGFRIGNLSKLGSECGDFAVRVKGQGPVTLGKTVSLVASLCAPAGSMSLGNGNQLKGQFVGDTIAMDRSNVGECCSCPPCPSPAFP